MEGQAYDSPDNKEIRPQAVPRHRLTGTDIITERSGRVGAAAAAIVDHQQLVQRGETAKASSTKNRPPRGAAHERIER